METELYSLQNREEDHMKEPLPECFDLLRELVSFKSVSADRAFDGELQNCAHWLRDLFAVNGFKSELIWGYGNAIVVARYDAGKEKTALIYGHYDVQPAQKEQRWHGDPFTLEERDGKWYGRGANDMKIDILMYFLAVRTLIEEGRLEYNVTFVLEGNEESDGGYMKRFIEKHAESLHCDFAIISDGQGIGDQPVFDVSVRGVFNATVEVRTADSDQHSGRFGGVMASAAECIVKFARLALKLPTDDPEGYYESPLRVGLCKPPEDLLQYAPPFNVMDFKTITGGGCLKRGCWPKDVRSRLGFMPNVEITGLKAGYCGDGYCNAVLSEAALKLNIRLAPGQSAATCAELFFEWANDTLSYIVPYGGSWNLQLSTPESGVLLWGMENPYLEKARMIIERITGAPAYLRADGGSIPVVTYFHEILNVPQVLLALGNEDSNIHSANENISVKCVERGLKIIDAFLGTP